MADSTPSTFCDHKRQSTTSVLVLEITILTLPYPLNRIPFFFEVRKLTSLPQRVKKNNKNTLKVQPPFSYTRKIKSKSLTTWILLKNEIPNEPTPNSPKFRFERKLHSKEFSLRCSTPQILSIPLSVVKIFIPNFFTIAT